LGWRLSTPNAHCQDQRKHDQYDADDKQRPASGAQDALLSIPTPEHYLPLLYVLALRREGERITFPVEGFDGGSVSMLSVQIG
jgi:aromatic ring-opening dioxygenase catalytic subunit (LigB family)